MADFLGDTSSIWVELDANGRVGFKTKTLSVTLDGIATDIIFSDYRDKQLLVITQFQKIGTLLLVTRNSGENLTGTNEVYDVKTISGLDSENYQLVARYLTEQLDLCKPVLFSICLKDHSLKTLKAIVKYGTIDLNPFLDPANESKTIKADIDLSELITLEDVMKNMNLGPNGALMYCMEFLEKNLFWLDKKLIDVQDHYFLFDCPGQVCKQCA
ncbi:hypothetical protein RUM43_005235 [Polyplax serrata]|uniref:GPN-loop GTPase 2 n=1 Tax=Polyplax serrata TaxID=468196 RepID=A0AAN8SBT0_POLSC